MSAIVPAATAPASAGGRSFLLERVQPALSDLMDGSLSILAPIFAVVLATHRRSKRPALSTSMVAVCLASMAGGRSGRLATLGNRCTWLVLAASQVIRARVS